VRQAFADDRGQCEALLREARKNDPERSLASLMNGAGVNQIERSPDDGILRFVMFRAVAQDLSFEESKGVAWSPSSPPNLRPSLDGMPAGTPTPVYAPIEPGWYLFYERTNFQMVR
jgi:hypothetical protein